MFQLITFCIAMIVCVDGSKLSERLARVPDNLMGTALAVALAGLFGLLIGASIGLGQIRQWRSMLFCGATGSVIGTLLLAIYAAPAGPARAIAAALLPLVTTIAVRVRTT